MLRVTHFSFSSVATVVLELIGNLRYLHCPVIEMPKFCAERSFGLVQFFQINRSSSVYL